MSFSFVLISSPLALLVALWGMTSKHVLRHMKSSGGQMVNLRNSQAGARLSQGEARRGADAGGGACAAADA
jgi:hypothetical protein